MTAALTPRRTATLLVLGLTAIFVGYFLVWLPGPSAGLRLIGVEMGEWIKFLGVGRTRDLFYLPPIALGLLIALWTATWPAGWRAWAARGLAVAVALLAFPAVASILGEPRGEWLARLMGVGLTALVAALSGFVGRGPGARWPWPVMAVVALAGALLPLWQYVAVRPVVENALRQPVGVGPGVWINALGGVLVAAVCLMKTFRRNAAA
ncbi:hypothetical protein [Promineifilum sp.]|uniref:hypothetical protein n=1 Tax=Promineifilum sp. TaxID=2664178 RepID=UPI0035B40039